MNDEQMIDCPEDSQQLTRLRAIMHRLRAPGGCPWDAEQTHESLLPNLIEEAYETVDTIRRGDWEHLKEELGDLLLQVVFHSELAEEAGRYNFDDVARIVSDKLVRRHPHVYGDSAVTDTDGVLSQWDAIKRQEKGDEEEPYLHNTGKGLPAMLRASKLQKKAAKVGFDWPDDAGVIDKIREELSEVEEELESGDRERLGSEIGDLLFSVVNLARRHKLDPEILLESTNVKFETRFHAVDQSLQAEGKDLSSATLDEMEQRWQQAK
ncbi:nucleoside triphosphate pyrophosphohydrolase [Verrucomicrobiaceae bacterium 5K15]|uniref:Nucleoside triphosphate pyrophosphohydrolase n=1 Tax=Oceaniferula flava TaxID=2800421 RepID=A0AAE2S970_9BACT|nr:nucleoside triphosphate pyrophosphohydrolase [Oceaniferula flavus]MBK1853565.1 nucleoside triphosphate pyrophosphohydrolase [Oceaniferula flavus]MBM1134870.1 nucleoside triphosphate pyrophosphohydrolase [Oceaniferula flavus]